MGSKNKFYIVILSLFRIFLSLVKFSYFVIPMILVPLLMNKLGISYKRLLHKENLFKAFKALLIFLFCLFPGYFWNSSVKHMYWDDDSPERRLDLILDNRLNYVFILLKDIL